MMADLRIPLQDVRQTDLQKVIAIFLPLTLASTLSKDGGLMREKQIRKTSV